MINNLPSEKIQRLLIELVNHYDKEDRAVRERQIRTWRSLKLFWESFQNNADSNVAHDWRIPNDLRDDDNNDQAYYDKPVNVFRAYLESIMAALSAVVPPIKCFPDDADNELDLLTAKASDKVGELIYRHNDASLVWLHALFIFCTEGLVAGYNHTKYDKAYGTYVDEKYENVPEEHVISICPVCQTELENTLEVPEPGVGVVCETCDDIVVPIQDVRTETVSKLVSSEVKPKARQIIEAHGGLYVKIPVYAKTQEGCPYLIYSWEDANVNIIEDYNNLKEELKAQSGVYDPYEAWGRLSPQYRGEFPRDVSTRRQAWLRPSAFNYFCDEDEEQLREFYPEGVKVTLINDMFAEAVSESLDEHWTLSKNPLADHLHHDPLGLLLVSIQEITNDIISLVLQTIEHGIPQTFADPNVLDFAKYGQMETIPGGIYPANPKGGKSLGEGFYEVRTATLSGEILPFGNKVEQLGQLVSGALPSLFGGEMGGSKTASEYAMSRSQALQRLQTTWKMLTAWWQGIYSKAIPAYIETIKEDEKTVERDEYGGFINIFIRIAELQGNIGRIELDAAEGLPISWAQRKDIVMQLIQLGHPSVMAILNSPENLPMIREAIGLSDLIIPGEADRNKQYAEIKELLNSEPIAEPDMEGVEIELSSVDIEPEMDNHAIEFEVCKHWAVSEAGQLAKKENLTGYKNVLLHAKMHYMFMMQEMMQMSASGENGAVPSEKPNSQGKVAPITGEEDVRV